MTTMPSRKTTVMFKKLKDGFTLVAFAWGLYLIVAGLWDLGREIANRNKTNYNY